ncbi:hypothetical protein EHS13_22485 [Paenibacillus psychroresistens]|uniref:Uncharacterized protein n=1 Tax=Paenibacillus psychroresistens TaxID=1778678 RepID=A0A6B8RPH3_9BACL|nr:hypothetical protein [Paenibacillus psychroresistens]QGQ97455.1 hypothetical protein EHS13_22485 [Paenibacillus psychroresistens]
MRAEFVYNDRLGIPVPELNEDWESYPIKIREQIVDEWEQIRGRIPERIFELEKIINIKQNLLNVEENFPLACQLNSQIAECASIINDLHLWYRSNQDLHSRVHQ